MVNFWLRTNKEENIGVYNQEFKLTDWDCKQNEYYKIGDQFVIQVTEFPKGNKKFIVGIYEVTENFIAKPISILLKEQWIKRPGAQEWDNLLYESIKEFAPYLLEMQRNQRLGKVGSQGLQLTESDFNKLKNLIEDNQ